MLLYYDFSFCNIFVKQMYNYPNIYSANIFSQKISTNAYQNEVEMQKDDKRISEYIWYAKKMQNVYPNICVYLRIQIYSNIQIFAIHCNGGKQV